MIIVKDIIYKLYKNPLYYVLIIFIIFSIILTQSIVIPLSILFRGGITLDYVVTGVIAALFTSLIVVSIISYFVKLLKESELKLTNLNKSLEDKIDSEIKKRRKHEQILIQQSKLVAMGEMVGAIAHQWRQPLNALGIVIQDIEDAYNFDELDGDYIKSAVKLSMEQLLFMSNTIDDFRNFFKPSKEKKLCNVVEIIKGAISLFEIQLERSKITIELFFGKDKCFYFMGYCTEFMQVIINLISNARDSIFACIEQNILSKGKISIEIYQNNKNIYINMIDNGEGIPDTIMDKIFEPYFTTKEEGKGVGIGLYMSKVIVENHMRGKLYVKKVDSQTMFVIEVPSAGLK